MIFKSWYVHVFMKFMKLIFLKDNWKFSIFFLHPLYILFQSKSKKRKLEEVKESVKRRQKMVDDDMDIVEGNEKSELTRFDVFHIVGVPFLC